VTSKSVQTLRLGTRGSQLALYQAHTVAALLLERAGIRCEVVTIKTSGDRLADATLSQIGGKRLFVKEIEDALLDGSVDIAVHSSKDMPAVLPEGLVVGAVLPREDPRDAIVLPAGTRSPLTVEEVVATLGPAPRIGTSSVRRSAQLTGLFPGAAFLPIRGNLDTRLRKVDAREFDAIVLAAAGLRRLQQADRITAVLPATACIPAPGQGIIAIEIRSGDEAVQAALRAVDDLPARVALDAERSVVRELGGGCQMPIGAFATLSGDTVEITAVVLSLDGAQVVRAAATGSASAADEVGRTAASELLRKGAADVLADVTRAHAAVEGIQP
jgi:hydroxymethylbilane synthase